MSNSSGSIAFYLWVFSPLILGSFKLMGIEPISNLPWHYVTFAWWWTVMVIITSAIHFGVARVALSSIKGDSK